MDDIGVLLIDWLDAAWFVIALFFLHKGQRLQGIIFVGACMLTLRLQVELMEQIGSPQGFFPLLDFPLLFRGYVVYGAFIAAYFMLMHFSKGRFRKQDHFIYIATSITIFTIAFCVSTAVMVL